MMHPVVDEVVYAGMTVKMVEHGKRWLAARRAMTWGYPRAITPREVETGEWFEEGPCGATALAWFVEPVGKGDELPPGIAPSLFDGALCVHGIASPLTRKLGKVMTPERLEVLEMLGECLGATKLYSLIPHETPDMPVRAMRRILSRLGWSEDEWGCYKRLGGD